MRLWLLFAIGIGLGASGLAQQDAKAFLKQVQQKYRNAKTLDMSFTITLEMSMGANMSRQQITGRTAIQFPNKVYAKISTPMGEQEIYSDGKTMYLYIPAAKQYMKQDAPADLRGQNIQFLGTAGLLFALINEDLDRPGTNRKFAFAGNQTVGGKQTRVVEVTDSQGNARTNLRLFIGAQDRLIYRIEANQTTQVGGGQSGQKPQQMSNRLTATITYAGFDKPIPASRFKFNIPKDAKEIKPQPMPGGTIPQGPVAPPQGGQKP